MIKKHQFSLCTKIIPCIFNIFKTRKHLIQLEYSKQTYTRVHRNIG